MSKKNTNFDSAISDSNVVSEDTSPKDTSGEYKIKLIEFEKNTAITRAKQYTYVINGKATVLNADGNTIYTVDKNLRNLLQTDGVVFDVIL
jgi:hypothetical protein